MIILEEFSIFPPQKDTLWAFIKGIGSQRISLILEESGWGDILQQIL